VSVRQLAEELVRGLYAAGDPLVREKLREGGCRKQISAARLVQRPIQRAAKSNPLPSRSEEPIHLFPRSHARGDAVHGAINERDHLEM